MQTTQETAKAIKATCGWHELEGKNVGDRVTVTTYRRARVGSGMDQDGELTGVLLGKSDEVTRCYGCSFAWREAEIRVD
jgi:hypothetical protein